MTFVLDFIAEIGVNHGGSIDAAELLLTNLKDSGGKVAKFQTYKAEKLVTSDALAYWDVNSEKTKSQIELFRKYDGFGVSEYRHLSKFAQNLGLEFMTTCFDLESLDLLDPLLSRHKIASADITNFPLIEAVAKKGKPILVSTGAASFEEIDEALNLITRHSSSKITLLHCVLRYPTESNFASLDRIGFLGERYPTLNIGYSDHTVPTHDHLLQVSAWLLGATVIEKHFTLDKDLPGNDHYHAFDPNDVKNFLNKIDRIKVARNFHEEEFLKSQSAARSEARRGLYFNKALRKGDQITADDFIALRPVGKCPAETYYGFIGKTLKVEKLAGSQPEISEVETP